MNRSNRTAATSKKQSSQPRMPRELQPDRDQRRRMFLESLEPRQLMALVVESFTPSASGFVVDFSAAIQTNTLNLYRAENDLLGPADVVVQGATTGIVQGSLVVVGDKLTFVKTGGALAADTYTVTLRSAANGIVDQALGELLDGEYNGTSFPSGNGTAGGNFVFNFTVAAPQTLVVSIPDFARGPTQALQSPASGSSTALTTGLPVRFSQAAGVTSFTMTITYDPALLTITGAELGKDAPSNAQVQANTSVAGQVTLTFFAINPLASGAAELVKLIGTVPENATYGAAQVLRISALEINSGAIQATADSGVHVVAYPGDANANRRYDAEDARLIARTGLALDTGFVSSQPTGTQVVAGERLYPWVDPLIVGDVTGLDGLSPLDASDLLRRVVGLTTVNIPALPTAQTPTGIALSTTNVAEGQAAGATVGTFTATDPDTGETFTYSLVSGDGSTDNASFTITGNTLKTAAVFNRTTKSSYAIRVRVTDSTNRTFEKTFTITVTAPNAAPTAVALSQNSVAENTATGTAVGNLSTTDANSGDTFIYTLVAGTGSTDNASFTIVNNQLRVNTALNFETKSSYTVRVRSTDQGGLFTEQSFTINVTDVNEAPTAAALSNTNVPQGLAVGTVVGTLSSTDPDAGETFTYTLVTGEGSTGNSAFTITGNQLKTNQVFNQATQGTYSIRVRTTDPDNLSFERTFTITITASNSAPTAIQMSDTNVDENSATGTVVGTLTSTDPNSGDTQTYSLVTGTGSTDNASFTIVGNELRTAGNVNFEAKSSYSIRVRTTDSFGLTFEQVFTITVNNLNEAATAIALSNSSVAENSAIDTVIGQLTATDPDTGNTLTFALVTGTGSTDNALFNINGNQLRNSSALNFETKSSYSIRVKVTDQGNQTFEQVLTITATDVNEQPTAIAASATSIVEGQAVGTTVGTLTTTDPDTGNTFTYTLVSGTGSTDNASFTIAGNQLKSAAVFNAATKSSYSIRVRSTDQNNLFFEQTLTITVTAASSNAAPTAIALSQSTVNENVADDTTVGTFTTTDPNSSDTHTYTLVTGTGDTDNATFIIAGNTLKTNANIDFETKSSYSVRVRSTDQGSLSSEKTFTITVNNLNEAPTAALLSSNSVAENAVVGTTVGTLSSTDPDTGNTHTYSLVAGTGDTDNAAFTISGNELKLAVSPNFETKSSYSVRVRTQDAAGLSFDQVLTINVTNVNEQPTALALSDNTVDEGLAIGTAVGTFSSTDPDSGNTHTYALVAGAGDTDNASFTIVNNELRTTAVFDFNTKASYSIRVSTTDQGSLSTVQTFTINVNDINQAPTAIQLSNDSVAEDIDVGTVIGLLTADDPDAGDTFTFTLVAGAGDSGNSAFQIVDDELRLATALDFETQDTYSIRVRATDDSGESFEFPFEISVTDVTE